MRDEPKLKKLVPHISSEALSVEMDQEMHQLIRDMSNDTMRVIGMGDATGNSNEASVGLIAMTNVVDIKTVSQVREIKVLG